mgnify:CR=1 FL=1
MLSRRPSLILTLALLPALFGCQPSKTAQPLSKTALAAVVAKPDAPRELLARAIDALFTDPAMGETRAVLIMHDGRIVAERYADGYSRDSKLIGWSMSKSITGVMIGLLVADGRLALDKSAPVPAWQRPGDPRGEITLRHLLQMRSGLRHVENAQPVQTSDTVRMLFLDGRDEVVAAGRKSPPKLDQRCLAGGRTDRHRMRPGGQRVGRRPRADESQRGGDRQERPRFSASSQRLRWQTSLPRWIRDPA